MAYPADDFRNKVAALLDKARVQADMRIATPEELATLKQILPSGDPDYSECSLDYGVVLDECVAIVFSPDTNAEPDNSDALDWYFNFERALNGAWSDGELYNDEGPFEQLDNAVIMGIASVVRYRLDGAT